MQTLRIINIEVNSGTSIAATFTDILVPNLITSNVSIIPDSPNVPIPEVLLVKVSGSILSIVCQPLTPMAEYFVQFQSTPQCPFISLHNTAKISEDGISNRFLISGPVDSENPVKTFLNSFLKDNIYNTEDESTVVSKYVNLLTTNLSKALYDIGQIKNENYLSFTVLDEQKVRGSGAFDRLNEESAYKMIRVGRGPSSSNATKVFSLDVFPSYPVTLQKQTVSETLQVSSIDTPGAFNINNLTITLNNYPITKVTSIIFTFISANPVYTYDIETLGYQINNSRYDQDFAFSYIQLENNQIKISDKVLEDPNFIINNIFKIDIQYEYKDLGRIIDTNSISIYTVLNSTREVIPPIINIFSLRHAPIVDSSNKVFTTGGVIFTDPNANIAGAKHPAFMNEIPFSLSNLPFSPGQYSIDYLSGIVYVFGNNLNNDGAGPYPPLATYTYRLTYKSEQDYIYDPDTLDLVSLPNGNLRDNSGSISFNYEEVLIPGTDYVAGMHQEVLTERINNNLIAFNVLKTQNAPITNVFRIFNETSGEIYTLDRWTDNKIYFRFNNAPRILSQTNERAIFKDSNNELLFINTTLTNGSGLKIYKILLNNNNIVSATEDSLGSSSNTSLTFSSSNIFINERWFNTEFAELANINRLQNVGDYIVDYSNGIIYCAVSLSQGFNIGSATYKINFIEPQFPHIISVDDIYYRVNSLNPKNKQFTYVSFNDGSIEPQTLDVSSELYLNSSMAPYEIYNNSIGVFYNSSFIPGVKNQIKFIRSVFEHQDLLNNISPLNFAQSSTSSGFNITTGAIQKQIFGKVQFDGVNHFVNIDENIQYISPNITYSFSIIRTSDSAQLWNGSGIVVTGSTLKLILPGIHSPATGDIVTIDYSFTINNLSRVVVDYNRGDYNVDYTYLADEIIVSYEYGDNILDFRANKNLPTNTTYYVSYMVGALRGALLKNFGTLVNVPILANIDIDFDRERYRDALTAALTSFIQGPTLSAIKNIGKTISHINPEIVESVFQNWSLGSSLLNPESISTTGSFQLLPAKFDNGVLINSPDQTITFPTNSNIRLEEGTFETWISPQWNGLDNDAELSFNISKNGLAINPTEIFIGASEYHPEISAGSFTLNKNSDVSGVPNKNKDGIFIYYNKDISGNFNRWYFDVIDGYVSVPSAEYKIKISSTGTFYDVKSGIFSDGYITPLSLSNITLFTGINSVNLSIASGGTINEGITFLSDLDHYLLDFGKDKLKNRLSIYKDTSGYLNFKVIDREKTSYSVSADISAWKFNDFHHVAASWKINTKNNRDEIHLFIDGFEVPNIIKYGQKLKPYLHEKFRTVNPEEIIGLPTRDIVASTDLQITSGSYTVSSSINFSALNIFSGDTIFIDEIGFLTSGYTISSVSGQNLILNSAMPLTLVNGRFSVNRTQFTVASDIDISPNIAVTTIHSSITNNDMVGIINTSIVSSAGTNFSLNGVLPGYLIRIDNMSLSTTYTILQVSGHTLVIDGSLAVGISSATFHIYSHMENEISGVRSLNPSYSFSKDVNFNNILTISNNIKAADLILIRTLGINHKKIKRNYYVWSDNAENILMTKMPPPISLDEASIKKIILSTTPIGPSNSTLFAGIFTSNNLITSQPVNSQNGRTISVTLSGFNIDFSTPVQITINGVAGFIVVNETISFTNYGTLDFINPFISINYINVVAKPLNILKNIGSITVKEKYAITYPESSGLVPVVRFSYQIGTGTTLFSLGGDTVSDNNNLFSGLDIGNYLVVQSPLSAAGFYKITGLSLDRKTLTVLPLTTGPVLPLPIFNGGVYQILNASEYRSGFQNGFFTFEASNMPGEAYYLNSGLYELEYFTYARIQLDPISSRTYLGSDFNSSNQANIIFDQVKIYSTILTDTRIGESIPANQRSITKDFNSIKALKKDNNTLMLLDFNSFPFTNSADLYITPTTEIKHFQSSVVVNENFGNSLVFLDKPLSISNDGILDTKKEGTIEFWVNPLFATGNDPNQRFYFDAFGAVLEDAVSVNNESVKLSAPASKILSVKLKSGDQSVDYFSGGKLEVDAQKAIFEEAVSLTNITVIVANSILQIITVKILGDLSEKDYFANGAIGQDKKTIYLGIPLPSNNLTLMITYQSANNNNNQLNTQVIRLNKKLPYQNSHVVVNYIPSGLQGDRISIFKDSVGYMNFNVTASGSDFTVRAPIFWAADTWHRVKASYKINGSQNTDEIRLFLDGYEFTNPLFGTGLLFGGSPLVYGSVMAGDGYHDGYNNSYIMGNITFKDPINYLFIGSEYSGNNPIFSLLDNFRISNVSRPIYAPYGESIDVNYSSNLDVVFPVTSDLFTTYLLDFNQLVTKNSDFAILKNKNTGLFDFSINIIDSLGIVNSNLKVKQVLETLLHILQPANSKSYISYTL